MTVIADNPFILGLYNKMLLDIDSSSVCYCISHVLESCQQIKDFTLWQRSDFGLTNGDEGPVPQPEETWRCAMNRLY